MTSRRSDGRPTLEELAAFADGALPRRKAHRVAAALRAHPAEAERLAAWLQLDARLREAHPDLRDTPLPEGLGRLLHESARDPGGRAGGARGMAKAAVALLVAAGVVAWLALGGERSGPAPSPSFVAAVLQAYRQGPALREPEGSLGPEAASAPDLVPLGLRLQGARTVRAQDRTFAEYVYRDGRGRKVVLYERADAPLRKDVLRIVEREDVRVVEWVADRRHYAMVGDHTVAGLADLAARIRRGVPEPSLAGAVEGRATPGPDAPPPASVAPGPPLAPSDRLRTVPVVTRPQEM